MAQFELPFDTEKFSNALQSLRDNSINELNLSVI